MLVKTSLEVRTPKPKLTLPPKKTYCSELDTFQSRQSRQAEFTKRTRPCSNTKCSIRMSIIPS